MSAISILHVVTDRDRRGAQVHAVDLAEGLAILGANVDVVALAPGDHGDLLDIDALGPSRRSPRTFTNLRLRVRSFDVVVAHGSTTLLMCSVGLAGTGVPLVYRQISDPLFWAGSWPRRLRVAAMIRRASRVVSLADGVGDVVAKHYRMDRARVTTIPNAVPAGPWSPPTANEYATARQQFGFAHTDSVMVYLGALVAEKGVDIAIRVAASDERLRLLVVGEGPERADLENLAAAVAPGRVRFVGSSASPKNALHAADLLVLPSRGGDSMPAVLIEAGLCALPSVTTDVGSIQDVVLDGQTGRVVSANDQAGFISAVENLISNPEEGTRLGRAALSRCRETFTIEVVAPHWIGLLEEVKRSS